MKPIVLNKSINFSALRCTYSNSITNISYSDISTILLKKSIGFISLRLMKCQRCHRYIIPCEKKDNSTDNGNQGITNRVCVLQLATNERRTPYNQKNMSNIFRDC